MTAEMLKCASSAKSGQTVSILTRTSLAELALTLSQARSRPALQIKGLTFPITLRVDDATAFKQTSVMVLSWTSLLVHGSEWATRYLITAMPSVAMNPASAEVLYEWLAWSLECLLEGKWSEPQFGFRASQRRRFIS